MFANLGEEIRSAAGGLFARRPERTARLIDTTMLFAPRSGGVKRYLTAKQAWIAAHRAGVRHTLVTPGKFAGYKGNGELSVYAAPLPFGDGYRWPVFKRAWMERLVSQRPTIIEAGDPYTPGLAALKAGVRLGIPVVGFCHTDLPALAALHIGEWAEKPVRRRWGTIYGRFDQVLTCSRYMAGKLEEAGVSNPIAMPLGVDTDIFDSRRADREIFRASLGLTSRHRLLVFAGRPAREKKLDVLVEAVEQLGEPYVLLMVGAGAGAISSDRVINLPYQSEPTDVAR
ncbi:MAG: glycosyl transferase group 1, partial [Caulobacteraceae bacterium]|nr:glycosyl transferase group 1 [Caulobacteraceae bacterium]